MSSLSLQDIHKLQITKTFGNQKKSVENLQNQLMNSREFSSGERFKNQETPDQIKRFGNLGCIPKFQMVSESIIDF